MIKVCNLVRLNEKDAKGFFKQDGQFTVLREGAKVLNDSIVEYQNNCHETGILWVVDEKATEERNKAKAPKVDKTPKGPKTTKVEETTNKE